MAGALIYFQWDAISPVILQGYLGYMYPSSAQAFAVKFDRKGMRGQKLPVAWA